MAYEYTVYPESSFVSVRFNGFVDEAVMDAFVRETLNDEVFLACTKELMDWREVDDVDLSAAYLRSLAKRIEPVKFDHLALVMPSNLPYGLARMYQAYRADGADDNARVFRDAAAAYEWLGVPG